MKLKPKAVGYIRVSGKHQIKGESLEVQERDIKKYAEYREFKYLRTYKDKGFSGADKDRPELNQLKLVSTAGFWLNLFDKFLHIASTTCFIF